jgi:sphingomyelin phosphodiesterase
MNNLSYLLLLLFLSLVSSIPIQELLHEVNQEIVPTITDSISDNIDELSFPILSSIDSISCASCESLTAWIAPFSRENRTIVLISKIAIGICELIRPQCSNPDACKDLCIGIVNEYAVEVMDIVSKTVLLPQNICFHLKLCPNPVNPISHLPDYIPVRSNLSDFRGQTRWPSWENNTGSGYFIQLSDIHLDLLYSVGSNTNCGEPLCCRAKNGPGTSPNIAQLWGDYNCDTTELLLHNVLNHIYQLNPPPDFILYTGDSPAHDIWEESRQSNLRAINKVSQLFLTYFPTIPVFNTLGNHEIFPVNQYEGPGFDSWLYNMLVVDWGYYLPYDAQRTLLYGGYYQSLIRPGLRVISLNNNYYANADFWLLINNTDISSQFSWLIDVLEQCKDRGEKSIIIGHIPPNDWESNFTNKFEEIISNYSEIILNQFYGHTHTAGLALFYPPEKNYTNSDPINMAYIGGSITSYTQLNPGFAVYYYNRTNIPLQSSLVTNFQQYWTNLAETNKLNITNWNKIRIDGIKDWELNDFSLISIQNMIQNMKNNKELYTKMLEMRYKGMIPEDPDSAINLECQYLSTSDTSYNQCMHKHGSKQEKIRKSIC